ncbi:MAG: hypothetical protein NZ750_08285 [Anaerolineae bacterium]|nr:hypothetical protein [Anaerolineae bacterium]MDW8172347.1 hypothetical protein [Anaerolineae bacterium]
MSSRYQIDADLREAKALAEGLANYLRGPELYGQAGGFFSSMPSLTVGALLLRLRRLEALRSQFDSRQRTVLDQARRQHDEALREWRQHYEQKVIREAQSRLEAMRPFLKEASDEPRQAANLYPPEMLRRTIVQELFRWADEQAVDLGDSRALARSIDDRLRSIARPSEFQWAALLAEVYPAAEFWWLYARPPQVDK